MLPGGRVPKTGRRWTGLGRTGGVTVGVGVVVCGSLLAACGGPPNATQPRSRAKTPTSVHPSTSGPTVAPSTTAPATAPHRTAPARTAPPSTTQSAGGPPPPVPSSGAYLGAWVQPAGSRSPGAGSFASQMSSLPALQQSISRPLAILHVYSGWSAPPPVAALAAISANGSIPLLDWGCGVPDSAVASGTADGLIRGYAEALKAYGRPVLLRWFWEMNLLASRPACRSAGGAADYVAAWQHIWTIFHEVGASNVAFVWCPGITGADPAPYYPGDGYVDWIGVDGYDRKGLGAAGFAALFSAFYAEWLPHGKPMMVAETGARPAAQAAYLAGAAATMAGSTGWKALVYFDAAGPVASWTLSAGGLGAFGTL